MFKERGSAGIHPYSHEPSGMPEDMASAGTSARICPLLCRKLIVMDNWAMSPTGVALGSTGILSMKYCLCCRETSGAGTLKSSCLCASLQPDFDFARWICSHRRPYSSMQ